MTMRTLLSIMASLILTLSVSAQTFHALIFSNMKESSQRAADRTEEMNNMRSFCQYLASTLGYQQDIRCHSDNEFTSSQFLRDLESMSVSSEDVVMLFYNGHGCNWDDDDWPHMCFKDKQYWQTTAYEKLQEKCGNAKLLLCIACCCNMDSRGRSGYCVEYDYSFDPNKARALFVGFSGKRKVVTSSSIRGQYSYSWTSGTRLGSIYGISLREAINEVLKHSSTIEPSWDNVLALAQRKTLAHTDQKQRPQYKIQDATAKLSPRAQKILNEMLGITSPSGPVRAKVISTTLTKNVSVGNISSLVIAVDFDIDNLSVDGGRVVAFLESPKGVGVKDLNGRYCTSDGKVSVGKDFGTRQTSNSFKDFELVIPMEELHISDSSKDYYIRVGVYDYRTRRYIAFGQYALLR